MHAFKDSLAAWNTEAFADIVKKQLENLPSGSLPLYQLTSQGGMVDDSHLTAVVLGSEQTAAGIEVRVGLFFTELVGGCNCHDDPVAENAYGECIVSINTRTGEATFRASTC